MEEVKTVSSTAHSAPDAAVLDSAPEKRAGTSPAMSGNAGKRTRRTATERGATGRIRYFLLTKEAARDSGKLVLGEEFETEDKALVASLIQGLPYLRIETWMANAQKQGKAMVIERRPQP